MNPIFIQPYFVSCLVSHYIQRHVSADSETARAEWIAAINSVRSNSSTLNNDSSLSSCDITSLTTSSTRPPSTQLYNSGQLRSLLLTSDRQVTLVSVRSLLCQSGHSHDKSFLCQVILMSGHSYLMSVRSFLCQVILMSVRSHVRQLAENSRRKTSRKNRKSSQTIIVLTLQS